LKECDYYVDSLHLHNGFIIAIVEWADWKHDHLYLDVLMKRIGYELHDTIVIAEDGSDCYSAERWYKKVEKQLS
jgi:hypothetical protein